MKYKGAPNSVLVLFIGSFGAHNLPATGLMNFCFKWRHRDGSILEFGPTGWTSDDPQKIDCLLKSDQPSDSGVAIPPGIRKWLQEECELTDFSGPND